MFSARYLLLRSVLSSNSKKVYGNREATISTSAPASNYYDALGIPKGSTQTDIKAAYYKLSMQYHPDKNQGSESAAEKFREISQAYEVLGNYRLRRLYDKGIINTAGSQFAQRHHDIHDDIAPEVEDDPETKFYKSRFKKSKVVDASGRTPIYDFDEWSRAHYGKSFQRRQDAKNKYDRQQTTKRDHVFSVQNEVIIFGMVFCMIVVYAVFSAESSYDLPRQRATRDGTAKRDG